jgi:hypothetical protein
MEDLIKNLERLSSSMEELNSILLRNSNLQYGYVHKKIEDGILESLHQASPDQLEKLGQNFKFKFYTDLNDPLKLESEITRRLREHKLNELGI